jgi:hypothetical protein
MPFPSPASSLPPVSGCICSTTSTPMGSCSVMRSLLSKVSSSHTRPPLCSAHSVPSGPIATPATLPSTLCNRSSSSKAGRQAYTQVNLQCMFGTWTACNTHCCACYSCSQSSEPGWCYDLLLLPLPQPASMQ